jgi:hypothetical protein
VNGTSERVNVWLGFALYLVVLFLLVEVIYTQRAEPRLACGN